MEPPFSPELDYLLTLLRVALDAETVTAVPTRHRQAIDWDAFVATVERHRVGAFLHERLGSRVAETCPVAIAGRLEQIATLTTRRALAQAAEQIRLVRLLTAAGIEVIPVKGIAIAHSLYGRLGVRHAGDVDLFVRVQDAERANAVLIANGLRRTRPEFPLTPRQTTAYFRLKPEFEYVNPVAGLRVELLWRLEGLSDQHAVWAGVNTTRLGGCDMRTLPRETEAVYLLQHGARHGWFRLFWLVDIALLFGQPDLDWARVMAGARAAHAARAVLQGAALVEELLGVPAPLALVPRSHEVPKTRRLVREARRLIRREARPHEDVPEWLRQIVYRVRLQSTTQGKLAMLTPHLFSPEGWRTWRLPDRWFFLYYFATPFLWAWRRARR